MSLVGVWGSRECRNLTCGDDGLDVGSPWAHRLASRIRVEAGFDRNPSKEVVSDRAALIKEVPLSREGRSWRVLTPLKVRVIAGTGDPEVQCPRYISDFWSLQEEVRRMGVQDDLLGRAQSFLLRRYGRPLMRVWSFGASVPLLGTKHPEVDWRLRRQDPHGGTDPLLVPAALGRSGGSAVAHLARWEAEAGDREPGTFDAEVTGSREVVEDTLAEDTFMVSWHDDPGRSPGSESVAALLGRLHRQMAHGDPFVKGFTNVAKSRLGPLVVGVDPSSDFRVYPTRSKAPLTSRAYERISS
jgi:hypothetical protein